MIPSLREMLPILLDYVAGFPLRCSIGDGLFRETASLLRLRVTFSKKTYRSNSNIVSICATIFHLYMVRSVETKIVVP